MSVRVKFVSYHVPKERMQEAFDVFTKLGFKIDPVPADGKAWYSCDEKITDYDSLDELEPYAEWLEIKPLKKLRFVKELPGGTHPAIPSVVSNAQIHFNTATLHMIKYIWVVEDACTDSIQSLLEKGAIILAVCPQGNRRPDYIMGRINREDFV